MFHRVEQGRSPLGELFRMIGLQRVLVQGVTPSPANAQVLRSLKKYRSHRQAVQFRTQAVDDLAGRNLALGQWLERNVDETGIGRATSPGKHNDVRDRRIAL